MHSILITVCKPDPTERDESDRYAAFVSMFGGIVQPTTGTGRLSENVWLLHGENESPLLAHVLDKAEDCKLSYKLLFIERATEWCRPSKD